jgi:hypothetical protein
VIVDDLANNNVCKVFGCIRFIDWYKASILRKSFNNDEDAIVVGIVDKVFGSW